MMIKTENLIIRKITLADAAVISEYASRNREYLCQWEPLRDDSYYSLSATEARIRMMVDKMEEGAALHLGFYFSDRLIGCCNLTNIVRGVFQACHLGFSGDAEFEGQGLMFEGLSSVIDYSFQELALHRIMASYKPDNLRSGRLLARLGFEKEGYARSYLKINGVWADHVLTSIICEERHAQPSSSPSLTTQG